MTQTTESRIFAHYKALKNTWEVRTYGTGTYLWLTLARKWQMPVQEVKRIIREQKEARRAEV